MVEERERRGCEGREQGKGDGFEVRSEEVSGISCCSGVEHGDGFHCRLRSSDAFT